LSPSGTVSASVGHVVAAETVLTPAGHVPELDGLRGVAVLMVIIGHGAHHPLVAVTGVSLFFVLSGFLITRILLRSVGRGHYFSNFYVRRALRIWPLYYLVLAVTFLTPLFSFPHDTVPAWRYLLYIQNFWVENPKPVILGPTWSLAIEEQFYMVWPLVVWLCRSSRRVAYVALALVALTPLFRVLYQMHGVDPYSMTFGRLDGLAAGAVLAAISLEYPKRRFHLWLFAACAAVSLVILPFLHELYMRKAFKDTSTVLLFFAVVGVAFFWRGTVVTAVLRSWPLRFFGSISYCAYLVHLPLFYRFSFPVGFLLTIVIATASFYLFESPINRLKDRFTRGGDGDVRRVTLATVAP
jgi:peptidoglycan/LPS O-acetylase OafA/YrhL